MERSGQQAQVTVVYGPPCSGKSTYIQKHLKPGDYLLDIDLLAQSTLSTPSYLLRNKEQAHILLNVRDAMLRELIQHDVKIWMQTTYIAGIFNHFKYELIEVPTTKEQCYAYLMASDRQDKAEQRTWIDKWFDKQFNLELLNG
jgi:predicted kinase